MSDEWIKHDGGPCPVPPEALVERDYGEERGYGPASGATWRKVLRYRFLAPVSATPPADADEAFIRDTAARIMAALMGRTDLSHLVPDDFAWCAIAAAEALAAKLKERKA